MRRPASDPASWPSYILPGEFPARNRSFHSTLESRPGFHLQRPAVPPDTHRPSTSVEDYLKAIFGLTQDGRPASNSALAEHLSIAPASVTGMVKRLKARLEALASIKVAPSA